MRVRTLVVALLCALSWPLQSGPARAESRFFTTTDGIRLHYVDEGAGRTLLFIPGWVMPAEIWRRQLDHFARNYRVIAIDPRSQGRSEIAQWGNDVRRHAEDLHEFIEHLQLQRVVLVGWSLGALEALLYLTTHGDDRLAALVVVDNSVGESPPQSGDATIDYRGPRDRQREMAQFVGAMFKSPQPPEYLAWLTAETLRTPPEVGARLLSIPYSKSFWRSVVYQTKKPLLYVVTASLKGQAQTLLRKRKDTSIEVFADAGHALFVDEAERFNAVLEGFLGRALAQ